MGVRRGDRYCKVVQSSKGFRIYSTRQGRQRRVRAHLRGGEGRPEYAQRGCQGQLRREGKPRQDVRGKSQGWLKESGRLLRGRRFNPEGFSFALIRFGDLPALPLRKLVSRCDRFRRSGKSSGPPPFASSLNVQGDDTTHKNSGFSVI
jgi:hypothetical protein